MICLYIQALCILVFFRYQHLATINLLDPERNLFDIAMRRSLLFSISLPWLLSLALHTQPVSPESNVDHQVTYASSTTKSVNLVSRTTFLIIKRQFSSASTTLRTSTTSTTRTRTRRPTPDTPVSPTSTPYPSETSYPTSTGAGNPRPTDDEDGDGNQPGSPGTGSYCVFCTVQV